MTDAARGLAQDSVESNGSPPVLFSPVRLDKFILLSIVTWGLYQVVWFYRNWRYIKGAAEPKIWPWARALFAPVWYYSFLGHIGASGDFVLVLAYFILVGAWRLDDPYWLVTGLSFLPLIPAVRAVNRQEPGSLRSHPSYGWRGRSGAVFALGILALPLVVVPAFGPPTSVVAGTEMRGAHLQDLAEIGVLEEGEEVLFFYSAAILSVRTEGVFASNLGVTSYWVDPVSEELMVAFLSYAEIQNVEVNYSGGPFEDTMVRLEGPGDSWFLFFLSPEGGGDRRFIEEVERRRVQRLPRTITT